MDQTERDVGRTWAGTHKITVSPRGGKNTKSRHDTCDNSNYSQPIKLDLRVHTKKEKV